MSFVHSRTNSQLLNLDDQFASITAQDFEQLKSQYKSQDDKPENLKGESREILDGESLDEILDDGEILFEIPIDFSETINNKELNEGRLPETPIEGSFLHNSSLYTYNLDDINGHHSKSSSITSSGRTSFSRALKRNHQKTSSSSSLSNVHTMKRNKQEVIEGLTLNMNKDSPKESKKEPRFVPNVKSDEWSSIFDETK